MEKPQKQQQKFIHGKQLQVAKNYLKQLKEKNKLKIPSDAQNGEILNLKELGMPIIGNSSKRDLKVTLIVKIPKIINNEVKAIYERLKEIYG